MAEDPFRWWALAALAGTIGVSAFHRRRARRRSETIPRTRESAALMAGRAAVSLPLFGGALVYVVNPAWMGWSAFPAPPWLRWTGVALGIACIPAAHWVLAALGSNVSETILTKKDHALVTDAGPYRWIRHPLYTTGIALFAAVGLIAASWFVLGLALLALVLVRTVVVPREEAQLTARFGARYVEYGRRTGAMWPRLRSRPRQPTG